MAGKKYLVTGGTGFIGAALVRRLVELGNVVRILDNNYRGAERRVEDVRDSIEMIEGDIRDETVVVSAAKGMDSICHLAFVNGTANFYNHPDLVLDVAVRGMTSVLAALKENSVAELVLASSSEVYQTPDIVPTPESVPLVIPDVMNPRYSYAAGKLINEMMAVHQAGKICPRVLVFRPHNVYGPDMGREHVIPQFIERMFDLCRSQSADTINFEIQGSGRETRAFVYIDDFTDGLASVLDKGEHLNTYHIGTGQETAISSVAHAVADYFEKTVRLITTEAPAGGTPRRCPDISKVSALGYEPKVPLKEGIRMTADWYVDHLRQALTVAK